MMASDELRLAAPRFGADAVAALEHVLSSGRLTDGPTVRRFERDLAAYVGAAEGVATTSATTALHLTLAALGIGPGDEVVVPDFTFPATGNAVLQTGASVRLADVDPVTYNLDPVALAAAGTDRTRAVLAVDLFGCPAPYAELERMSADRGWTLVCDAACSLGAAYRGRRCGSLGAAACFSFHPRKLLTTGEGGMVTTSDPDLAARMRRLSHHGGARAGWRTSFEEPGFNYRLTELQAALGLVQLPGHDAVVARRRELAHQLSQGLGGMAQLQLPRAPEDCVHVFQAFVCVVAEGVDRDAVVGALRERGVEATLGTYALHAEPAYRRACGTSPGDLPVSWSLVRRSLALPLHEHMSASDIERLVVAVQETVAGAE